MPNPLTHGATYHRAEVLPGILIKQGVFLAVELAKRMRIFDWTTDLRYEAGRKDTSETNGLLRTAKAIYEWVEEQITWQRHEPPTYTNSLRISSGSGRSKSGGTVN
jgi:hypothetical protein